MHVVHIPRQTMIDIAQRSKEKGLFKSLQAADMVNIDPSSDHVPPGVRRILRWGQIDTHLHSQVVQMIPLYCGAVIYTAVVNPAPYMTILAILSVLALPLGALAHLNRWTNWAEKKVLTLLKEPFIFVDNAKIYANFPELNDLETRLYQLEVLQQEATLSAQNIQNLANRLKEKLILMGESTNDPVLSDLENQHLRQCNLIQQSKDTMLAIEDRRQHCLRVRQDLFDWVELDWLKRQANQITGREQRNEIWQKAVDMELLAHDLQTEVSGIQGELGRALAEWQTRHDLT